MTKNYLAITIGPIDKTLAKASRTREVWLSSYIFSYLMGLIVTEIIARKIGKVILPDSSLLDNWKAYYGAGVFNDRCIVELEKEFGFSDFVNLRECVINNFLLGKQLSSSPEQENTRANLHKFYEDPVMTEPLKLSADTLKDYLQIYGLVTSFDPEKDTIVNNLNILLDGLERQSSYQLRNNNIIEQFFENVAWFYPLGFDLKNKEIKQLELVHQYFCVVHINADNLKNYYNQIGNNWNVVNMFNNCMISFSKEAAKIINDFGGQPIYMAGDDLFFIAPVLTTFKENICNVFDLIRILDFIFKDIFSKKGIQPLPDLSCGLSVSHNNYPLAEAVLHSKNMLSKAKNMPSKNSIAVQLNYSEGKSCQAIFNKSKNASFDDFIELLKDFPSKSFYISSIQGKIHNNMKLLQVIGKDNPPDFSGFLGNEYKPADNSTRLFIERSSRIFTAIFKEQKLLYAGGATLFDTEVIAKACEGAILQLDSIYRLLNFLTHTDHG